MNRTILIGSVLAVAAVLVWTGATIAVDEKGKMCPAGMATTQPAGQCCAVCPGVSAKLTGVQAALNDLEKAIESGDKAAMQAKLKVIRDQVTKADVAAHGFANSKCPIMGGAIDINATGDAVRTWKEMKIGFCCNGCPAAWDKLSDAEKQAKLDAAK
jgi:hypothetical protein